MIWNKSVIVGVSSVESRLDNVSSDWFKASAVVSALEAEEVQGRLCDKAFNLNDGATDLVKVELAVTISVLGAKGCSNGSIVSDSEASQKLDELSL